MTNVSHKRLHATQLVTQGFVSRLYNFKGLQQKKLQDRNSHSTEDDHIVDATTPFSLWWDPTGKTVSELMLVNMATC